MSPSRLLAIVLHSALLIILAIIVSFPGSESVLSDRSALAKSGLFVFVDRKQGGERRQADGAAGQKPQEAR